MADNTNLLDRIRKVIREENEPIKKRLDEQGQAIAQVKTGVEALAAGQKEIKETMATKADVLSVGVKVDKLKKHIEGMEDDLELPHRDKN